MPTRKASFGTVNSGTGGITSLGASSTFTAGYAWYLIDNTVDLAVDRRQYGTFRPTSAAIAQEFRLYAIPSFDGVTWPDVFDGTVGAFTWTSAGVRDSVAVLAYRGIAESSSGNRTASFTFSVSELFGIVPPQVLIFATHNLTSVSATGSTHSWFDVPIYEDVI